MLLATGRDASAATAASYSERVTGRASLESYWRLGETAGKVAEDVKSGRDGTYAGGVTLGVPGALTGDPDKAALFDGKDDSVTLPTLPSAVEFTVSGWQRLSNAPTNTNNTLYGGVGALRLMPRPSGFYAGVFVGGSEYALQGTTASNLDSWVHWALVRSGGTLTLYRNGVQAATRTGLPTGTQSSPSGQIGRYGTIIRQPGRSTTSPSSRLP